MNVIKSVIKYLFVFSIVFSIFGLIYSFLNKGFNASAQFEKTFLANESQKDLGTESVIGPRDNLTEQNINKKGFYIRIDKIGLFKPVVKNVDPRYKEEYVESWKQGVSHGKFTALPDQIGNTYFFAHAVSNEKYMEKENAWFTKIDELSENDEIIVYYNEKKFVYQITRIYQVPPTATGVYTGVSPVPKVTLQTCGPPRGSIESRYMIEALNISSEKF